MSVSFVLIGSSSLTTKVLIRSSRAVQIGMNLGVLEEWVGQVGLPRGVESHFSPVRELLHWLQVGDTLLKLY